eukprot:TRINITY_DN2481_c0_g1_i2.p1 TRINITY_DN2481_c0_g1~~TRINITY_DN2481_c0_g1_i2.p1  ORF type:complete len:468 (-),score=55.79 TRINITY_DN2481_c0_g1_i2:260-1663(-)
MPVRIIQLSKDGKNEIVKEKTFREIDAFSEDGLKNYFGLSNVFLLETKKGEREIVPGEMEVSYVQKNPKKFGDDPEFIIIGDEIPDPKNSSQGLTKRSFNLRWKDEGNNDVSVAGTWEEGKEWVPKKMTKAGLFWTTNVETMKSKFLYKFLVDGQWKCDENATRIKKSDNENNSCDADDLSDQLRMITLKGHDMTPSFGKERVGETEGIKFNAPHSLRTETVRSILKLSETNEHVVVKGTAFSGKTSIAMLLYNALVNDKKTVFGIDCTGISGSVSCWSDLWYLITKETWENTLYSRSGDLWILLDEANRIYDTSKHSDFWDTFKNSGKACKIHTVFFSQLHPGILDPFGQILPNTPPTLKGCPTIQLRPSGSTPGLIFTAEEYTELSSQFRTPFSKEALNYIHYLTGGHAGLVRFVFYLLDMQSKTITNELQLFQYLHSNGFVKSLMMARGNIQVPSWRIVSRTVK